MSPLHQSSMAVNIFISTCLLTILSFCNTALSESPPDTSLRLFLSAHPEPGADHLSVGERFTLQCNVRNVPEKNYITTWFKDGAQFANGGALMQGQTSVDGTRSTMVRAKNGRLEIDTLTIEDLQISDEGNFTCQIWLLEQGVQQAGMVLSDSYVIMIPQSSTSAAPLNMNCSTSNTLAPEGDVIPLSCQVDTSGHEDQMTVLYWTIEGIDRTFEGVTTVDPSSNTAKMVINFVMSTEYNSKLFTCHVNQTHGVTTETLYQTCSVGPFMTPSATQATTSSTGGKMPRFKMEGMILIIVIVAASALFLCCIVLFICYCCCCRTTGDYEIKTSRIRRLTVRKKRLVPTPSAAVETADPPRPRLLTGFDESPYYSSVGPVPGEGQVRLTSGDRSAADGASYTALLKTDSHLYRYDDDAKSRTSSADIVDEDGYNFVGIGVGTLQSTETVPSEATVPSEVKLKERSSTSLKRGFTLGSLSRHGSRHGSRSSSRASTPVNEEKPYYKTLMKPEEKSLETPYYLSVFPPGVTSGSLEHKKKGKVELNGVQSDDEKASSVPKHVGGHAKVERKGVVAAEEAGYLSPKLSINGSKSDPKFSNAMYNVY